MIKALLLFIFESVTNLVHQLGWILKCGIVAEAPSGLSKHNLPKPKAQVSPLMEIQPLKWHLFEEPLTVATMDPRYAEPDTTRPDLGISEEEDDNQSEVSGQHVHTDSHDEHSSLSDSQDDNSSSSSSDDPFFGNQHPVGRFRRYLQANVVRKRYLRVVSSRFQVSPQNMVITCNLTDDLVDSDMRNYANDDELEINLRITRQPSFEVYNNNDEDEENIPLVG